MTALAAISLLMALIPALLFFANLSRFRVPPPADGRELPPVSVLIPARDEAGSIGAALRAVQGSEYPDFEVVVLDDGSEDATAAIVARFAEQDARVRLETAPPLPPGWCGKNHACAVLAGLARHERLCFVDADVRLAADGLARGVGFLEDTGAGMVSGFPRQETGSWLEHWLIPLIQFVLLGFLPMGRMRRYPHHPGYAAACGQWIIARRDAYETVGGHGAIARSIHDGVQLPRVFRRAGFTTDLFDATPLAHCRMYHDACGVWQGLAKNAHEGLGHPTTIVPFTLLLGLGQVLPLPLLWLAWEWSMAVPAVLAGLAAVVAYLPRVVAVHRFHQSEEGAVMHPLGVLLLLVIQWQGLWRYWRGRPARWKGRAYGGAMAASSASKPGEGS